MTNQTQNMSDETLEDKELKSFNKALDEEIIEIKKVKVKVPIINKYSGRVEGFEDGEKEVEESVVYTQARVSDKFCRPEDHYYATIRETKAGYTADCSKCNHGRFVNPQTHTLKDGKIIFRKAQNGKISATS